LTFERIGDHRRSFFVDNYAPLRTGILRYFTQISTSMNVLVIGSGGREHALCWKLAQSTLLEALYATPGNPGTAEVAQNVDVDINDHKALKRFLLEKNIRFVVVGPETPLVEGLHDRIALDEDLQNVVVIGPKAKGAMLEGSKAFAKKFMKRHNVPTAAYKSFDRGQLEEAIEYLGAIKAPYVLKADGLAGGKGVVILNDIEEAKTELKNMLAEAKFGDASNKVIIEEFLTGVELSVFIITNGRSYKLLPSAKDHKRIGEGDTGPNTGGMGAISPVPFANKEFMDKVRDQVIVPTVRGLHLEGIPYQGFLFIGLMNVKGEPYVIEYNVRMGDPETQAVLPRLRSDLLELFDGIATGTLSECHIDIDDRTTSTIVLTSAGYPGPYEKGKEINIGEDTGKTLVFHAGTEKKNGKLLTNGGRVLSVTGYGKDVEHALKATFPIVQQVDFDGKYFRTDIGADLIRSSQKTKK